GAGGPVPEPACSASSTGFGRPPFSGTVGTRRIGDRRSGHFCKIFSSSWHGFGDFEGFLMCGERSLLLKQLFSDRNDLLRLEAEFFRKFLERRRGAERMHADDSSLCADITLPSEGGSLFYCHPGFYFRGQHALLVFFGLVLEEIPGGHRNDS